MSWRGAQSVWRGAWAERELREINAQRSAQNALRLRPKARRPSHSTRVAMRGADDSRHRLAAAPDALRHGGRRHLLPVVRIAADRRVDSAPRHHLTPRERDIMHLRYGLEDGRQRTLEEVGRLFNITRERVRQIEHKAFRKLRQPAWSSKLAGYLED